MRELGGINANKQIKADLTKLYEKHKELFAKPSDVFRLIKAVKENPTFFYNNNEPNTALIGKILDNGKLGKIGIQKDYDSEYLKLNHATYSSKADKENKRLLKRNEKSHLVGSPTPTQLTLGEATEPTADGAKALLDENSKDAGIIQTFIQPGSKSNSELGLPNEIIPKQTQELDKTFKNQKDKNTKTINARPHIASGLLGGTANGADENGNVSPEEFAKGFIYALFGSKITAEGVRKVSPELYSKILSISKKPSEEVKNIVDNAGVDKLAKQEKRGIYNVTYNGKFSTPVYKDLEDVDDATKYAKGDKSKGAKHISIRHLNDESKEGYVTRQELLSLGENIRAYLKENKEPFIDKSGGHIYEWEDKDGVRFRAVIGQAKRESDDRSITSTLKPTDEATKSGIIPNSSLYSSNDIITFYSDRNLKEPMKFENPKLKLLDAIDTSGDKVGLVKKVLLNKDISDGVKAKAVNRLTKNKISQATKNSYISTKNSDNN